MIGYCVLIVWGILYYIYNVVTEGFISSTFVLLPMELVALYFFISVVPKLMEKYEKFLAYIFHTPEEKPIYDNRTLATIPIEVQQRRYQTNYTIHHKEIYQDGIKKYFSKITDEEIYIYYDKNNIVTFRYWRLGNHIFEVYDGLYGKPYFLRGVRTDKYGWTDGIMATVQWLIEYDVPEKEKYLQMFEDLYGDEYKACYVEYMIEREELRRRYYERMNSNKS